MSFLTTNQAQRIIDRLERHKHIFDFDRNELGQKLCRIASLGAYNALQRGEQADGQPLAALSKDYDEWKSKHYPGRPIGILDFEMARWENFVGRPQIDTHEASVEYGISEDAKNEAAWFIEGDPKRNRPPRPFWGLTAEALDAIRDLLSNVFSRSI